MERFNMDRESWMTPAQKKQLEAVVTANVTAAVTAAVTATVRKEERKIAADKYAKLAKEYALKEKALKRKAAEKDDIISYLMPPKSAKNDYIEQKPAKYVFKCMDGDIQIPEYGIFRTDFYNKERINHLDYY